MQSLYSLNPPNRRPIPTRFLFGFQDFWDFNLGFLRKCMRFLMASDPSYRVLLRDFSAMVFPLIFNIKPACTCSYSYTYVASYRESFIENFYWNFNAFQGISYLLLLFTMFRVISSCKGTINSTIEYTELVAIYTVQLLAMFSLSFIWLDLGLDILSCVGALQSRKHASLVKCVRGNMYH